MKLTKIQRHLLSRLAVGLHVIYSRGSAPHLRPSPGSPQHYEDWRLRIHVSTLQALANRGLIEDVSVKDWKHEYIISEAGRALLAEKEKNHA